LADALEAIIGAVYIDGGFAAVERFVHGILADAFANLPDPATLKDPKTRLQELLQERGVGLPEYATVDVRGPAHRQVFEVSCRVPPLSLESRASGGSRRAAEQAAAEKILAELANAV
ncbi:MAG TPA: putative dsRNA-binding protein, partial [Gammaproteobacteria bacterium]